MPDFAAARAATHGPLVTPAAGPSQSWIMIDRHVVQPLTLSRSQASIDRDVMHPSRQVPSPPHRQSCTYESVSGGSGGACREGETNGGRDEQARTGTETRRCQVARQAGRQSGGTCERGFPSGISSSRESHRIEHLTRRAPSQARRAGLLRLQRSTRTPHFQKRQGQPAYFTTRPVGFIAVRLR